MDDFQDVIEGNTDNPVSRLLFMVFGFILAICVTKVAEKHLHFRGFLK
jgi:hypothetical protein